MLLPRRRRLAGTERDARLFQGVLDIRHERVRAAEHAPRNPFRVLESRHAFAEIVERGGGVLAECPRVVSQLEIPEIAWTSVLFPAPSLAIHAANDAADVPQTHRQAVR